MYSHCVLAYSIIWVSGDLNDGGSQDRVLDHKKEARLKGKGTRGLAILEARHF